jgi:hypothetical protein
MTERDAINLHRVRGLAPISPAFPKKTYRRRVSGEANMRAGIAEIVAEYSSRLDRVTLDTLLWILGGFSNDYSRPRTERWSAEEDARLISYYRAHSPNGRLAYEAMMELKLKFRTRSKPALYGRICELRKAGRLDPTTRYSSDSSVAAIFRPVNHATILAPTLSGGAS